MNKGFNARRWAPLLFVLAACVPIPWWAAVPTLKLLSMALLIAGMQLLRSSRQISAATPPGLPPQPDGSVAREKRKRALARVAVTGVLAAAAHFVLMRANASGTAHAWHLYLYAAAVGAFFWTLSGVFMR